MSRCSVLSITFSLYLHCSRPSDDSIVAPEVATNCSSQAIGSNNLVAATVHLESEPRRIIKVISKSMLTCDRFFARIKDEAIFIRNSLEL